jgi:Na+-transporting methylmalonyl-CoA/oxaloacetate decarboxylase gamma subunit
MFELAASELLYPPGQPTLPVRIVSLFNDFKLGPGMALAMLNVGLVIVTLLLLRIVPWGVRNVLTRKAGREKAHVSTDPAITEELRVTAGRL